MKDSSIRIRIEQDKKEKLKAELLKEELTFSDFFIDVINKKLKKNEKK